MIDTPIPSIPKGVSASQQSGGVVGEMRGVLVKTLVLDIFPHRAYSW